jgi:hypothetical protein
MLHWIVKLLNPSPYVHTIAHEDWTYEPNGSNPKFVISRKLHKRGRKPLVQIIEGRANVSWENENGDIVVYRKYPMWQGTPFYVRVRISK